MKFLLAIILTFSTLTFNANAEEAKQAPAEVISEIKKECEEYAKEDEVSADEMEEYILNCVNEELAEQGYAEIEKL